MLRVRSERLRRGWSQTVLAYHARLSASDVSRIENGMQRPYPKQATALAKALEIPVAELLEEIGASDAQKPSSSQHPQRLVKVQRSPARK